MHTLPEPSYLRQPLIYKDEYKGCFFNWPPQFQYQKENRQSQPFLLTRFTGTAAVIGCLFYLHNYLSPHWLVDCTHWQIGIHNISTNRTVLSNTSENLPALYEQFYCISRHINLSRATLLPTGTLERKIEIFRTKNATSKIFWRKCHQQNI